MFISGDIAANTTVLQERENISSVVRKSRFPFRDALRSRNTVST